MAKKTAKHKGIEETIEVPEGVEATLNPETGEFNVKGPKGEINRKFKTFVKMRMEGKKIILSVSRSRRIEKKNLYTIISHMKNMFKGVKDGYVYKLQICFLHFPATLTLDKVNNQVIIKNFLGEAAERRSKILPGVNVEIDKDIITVSGCDKETTGQTAANLEVATRITAKDRRIFQDGIFIIEKPGEK